MKNLTNLKTWLVISILFVGPGWASVLGDVIYVNANAGGGCK